jgi:hypothetical protein
MLPNIFSFPSELRNRIYELLLLYEEPIDPWINFHQPQKLTPGLFGANKIINREATSLFYAQNCFDFTGRTSEDITLFLKQIGHSNANYIRHICVDFPNFLNLDPDNVTLEDDSSCILAKIQRECANLNTFKTSLSSTNAMELRLDALDNPKIVSEALKLVNTRFRASSSLQEIIVEVYEDGPSDHIRREMKTHGWKISTAKNREKARSDWSFDDSDDYDDDGYDDDDYDDDYDIDNDSDFWRRAGD